MVKLFSWRKEAGDEMRWGKRWSFTFYFKKADRIKYAQARAETEARDDAARDSATPKSVSLDQQSE